MDGDALGWLLGLEQFGIKLGLDTITRLLDALGHPERTFQSIHIAGTNGKGSVTAMAEAIVRAAGHRTGRYTSPHLVDLTERFAIDGQPVPRSDLVAVVAGIRSAVERLRREGVLDVWPTFFEVTTAAAFELFRRAKVTVAVCETGLGGRLDATNTLAPIAAAITTIGFDHQQHLGSTIELIAKEKAGIIKPGVPVVIGRLPSEALAVVAAIARDRGAPLVPALDDRTLQRARSATIALGGAHQIDNAAVAIRVVEEASRRGRRLEVPEGAIAAGLAGVRWPGRLDWRRLGDGREALLDAAHNPDGAAALAAYLRAASTPGDRWPLVFGAMADKDAAGILHALAPVVRSIVCTRASTPRAEHASSLAAMARRIAPQLRVDICDSPADALELAWQQSPRIVVAGSIFLIGDVIQIAFSGEAR